MTQEDETKISIQLPSDKMEAFLILQQGLDPADLSSEIVTALALSHAVQQGPTLKSLINEAIKAYPTHDFSEADRLRMLIAEGRRPIDGDDESFEFTPELQAVYEQTRKTVVKDQEQAELPAEDADEEQLDYRDRTSFMIVKSGQRIGSIHPATQGTDGIDVCGNNVPAKPGKASSIKVDPYSLERHEDGSVYAKVAGRLSYAGDAISVSPTLEINGYVDFSTGNIDFPGNIVVSQGVRDGFHVQSGKSIAIGGLVEAAELVSGRDITLKVGMAGRGKGTIFAGRDLNTTYLDACDCQIARDLTVENDINDCTIIVTRDIVSPSATLLSGEIAVLGHCELAQVGSPTGAHSVITLGRVPKFDEMVSEALEIINKCRAKAQDCINKQAELNADPDSSTMKAELLTQLQFEAAEHESKIQPLMEAISDALAATESTHPRLTVHKRLCQNAEIRAAGLSAVLQQDIEGPIEITLDSQGQLVCKDLGDGTQVQLSLYAKIEKSGLSFTPDDLPDDLQNAA
ncbi:MAG: FapA family protein [Phycisphaerales bacterium]